MRIIFGSSYIPFIPLLQGGGPPRVSEAQVLFQSTCKVCGFGALGVLGLLI